MTKTILDEKADEAKKLKLEQERLLVKEYKNNAERLKKIPFELEQVKDNLALTKENIGMQIEKTELQIKDLGLRETNFEICDVKYKWEEDPTWLSLQKDLMALEIKQLEFSNKMQKKSLLQTESNYGMQIAEIEAQEKRCFDSHKEILKKLTEEHKFKPEQLSGLKKDCNYKCCR